ncbi:MAG: response regulator [Lachnospiraceae bacterium]|nr:response regulator [Lachnospiraceae bacterium]
MIKVLLVDDEPFILEGLSQLIDWEDKGCRIVKKAVNGRDAYEYLKENEVDLVFADIKMPVMTGLELLQAVREEDISKAYFVMISGYNDFHYAQQALKYSALEYLLKPVGADGITDIIEKVKNKNRAESVHDANEPEVVKAYLIQNIMLLFGRRFKEKHIDYIRDNLHRYGNGDFRYVSIGFGDIDTLEEQSDEETLSLKNRIYSRIRTLVEEDSDRLFADIPGYTDEYELGFIYSDNPASGFGSDIKDYLGSLSEKLKSVEPESKIVFLAGKKVEDLTKLSLSYSSAASLKPYRSFGETKSVYIYEEDVQISDLNVFLCKDELDELVSGIELDDKDRINRSVNNFFDKINSSNGISDKALSINTNYLLFRLLHLAVELDESINQEEVMTYISDNALMPGEGRGSRLHMQQFASEYAEYLASLRKNTSGGILLKIEKELEENYAENITLKNLSAKYYVNSSYLGQLFKKRYGISFKDYLSRVRIDKAAVLLLKSDKKIAEIANEVGYHDTDYFIDRFIELKGCTPAKFRKNH